MSSSPRLSPAATLAPLPSFAHSRRSSYTYPHHPQLTHRSSSQSSLHNHGHSLGSLLGEARKTRFETLQDLPTTPVGEPADEGDAWPFDDSALQLDGVEEVAERRGEGGRVPNGAGSVYTSLPSTPIRTPRLDGGLSAEPLASARFASSPNLYMPSGSPPRKGDASGRTEEVFGIWDYLKSELVSSDADQHQEMKWERVENFLLVPLAVEKILMFGFLLCLDAFLYIFTILPIRFMIAVARLIPHILPALYALYPSPIFRAFIPARSWDGKRTSLPPSSRADLLRMALLVSTFVITYRWTDSSRIYHAIRGQDTIKLYVIFNAVEIADRLLCAIGQDLVDCLFSRSTLSPATPPSRTLFVWLRVAVYFVLSLLYSCIHSMTLIYYLTSLNVAINSYDNSLLTLLLSNQFVEIKGSVFKKFEKENLFQITCADIVERFQLALMLSAIALRNVIELRGSDFSILPVAFSSKGSNILSAIFSPVAQVMLSEVAVDCLKHAFITKFNSIRVSVYERFTDVLCRDLVSLRPTQKHAFVDHSPLVSRRLGLATIPLACVMLRISCQALLILHQQLQQQADPLRWVWWLTLGILFWLCAVVCKVLLGIRLIAYAVRRRAGTVEREKADEVNDLGRNPMGQGVEEQMYKREVRKMLDRKEDDQRVVPDMVIVEEEQKAWGKVDLPKDADVDAGGKKKKWKLEELNRWTMVKRIW